MDFGILVQKFQQRLTLVRGLIAREARSILKTEHFVACR